ncbi:MAG: hypothetical protein AMXMBFR64_25340 [Myxococcales bacterium]
MPYAGFLVRALEAVKYLIENWEDPKNAPEALYELAKALPSIGRMLARVDWSSVEWGKTLTALVMADIPNFAEIKQIARFAREADAKGLLPDEIKGSELYQAIMNTDSANAIASALEKLSDKEREALLDALKKGKREGMELPDDVEAFLLDKARVTATAKDLRDLEAMEGDLQALGMASATAQVIGAAGGSDAAAGSVVGVPSRRAPRRPRRTAASVWPRTAAPARGLRAQRPPGDQGGPSGPDGCSQAPKERPHVVAGDRDRPLRDRRRNAEQSQHGA